jgi:mannitol-specific phosphotransferase system IIBC component
VVIARTRKAQLSLATLAGAMVCFFLPWFQLSCGGEKAGSLSGWELASGVASLGELQAGHYYVFLLPGVLLAVTALLSVQLARKRPAPFAVAISQMVAGVLGVVLPLVEYMRLRWKVASSGAVGALHVETRFAFWGILVLGSVLVFLGFLSLPRSSVQSPRDDSPEKSV